VEPDASSLLPGGGVSVTIRAGDNEQTFTLNWNGPLLPDGLFVKFNPPAGTDFLTEASGDQSTVGMTAMRRVGSVETDLGSAETVTWTSVMSSIAELSTGLEGVWKRNTTDVVDLPWGNTADGTTTWVSE
jgi:hypothetical protein